jgi:hypothetical protein
LQSNQGGNRAVFVVRMGEIQNCYDILFGKSVGKNSRCFWDEKMNMDFKEVGKYLLH